MKPWLRICASLRGEHRVQGTFGGETVFYIGKTELMRNKSAVGRHQDLADLDLLRRFS